LTFWYFPLHHTSSLWRSSDFPNFPCINILSNLSYLMLSMTPLPNGPIFSCSNQSFKKIQTLNPLASLIPYSKQIQIWQRDPSLILGGLYP
jgi:hypothetical protein